MSEDDLTPKDFENFDEKTKEEKMETLGRLQKKIEAGEDVSGLLQQVPLEGELTVKVLDDDGNEKQVEKKQLEK